MSDLTKETIHALTALCRIQLTEEEEEQIYHDLNRVLDHIEQLKEVDVSDLTPYSHANEQGVDSLREDVVGEPLARETFLSNAPDHVGGMVRIPPVMKQNPQ